jgi:hypothetical protein
VSVARAKEQLVKLPQQRLGVVLPRLQIFALSPLNPSPQVVLVESAQQILQARLKVKFVKEKALPVRRARPAPHFRCGRPNFHAPAA